MVLPNSLIELGLTFLVLQLCVPANSSVLFRKKSFSLSFTMLEEVDAGKDIAWLPECH
jgi:hypothetical protein